MVAVSLIAVGFLATRDLMVPATERWVPALTICAPFALASGALMLWYVLSRGGNKWAIRTLLMGSVIGYVGGLMYFPGVSAFAELMKRWLWARGGGTGESREWGEPLLYIVFGGYTTGLVGAVLGMSLGAVALWARKKTLGHKKLDHDEDA